MAERTPLLPNAWDDNATDRSERQQQVGELLESRTTHRVLLSLIAIDAVFVLMDLAWNVLNPTCDPGEKDEAPEWLENLSYVSLVIDFCFLVEIPLAFYAFGTRYYGLSIKRPPVPHFALHLFDALVIIGTVILEVVLRGRERELAGLLIILRLWRIVKLVGAVGVGVGQWDESAINNLAEARSRIAELEKQVVALRGALRLNQEVA